MATDHSVEEEFPLFFFIERYRQTYVTEVKEFIRCVSENEAPTIPGIDGRISFVMGKAAIKLFRENRLVRLDEI